MSLLQHRREVADRQVFLSDILVYRSNFRRFMLFGAAAARLQTKGHLGLADPRPDNQGIVRSTACLMPASSQSLVVLVSSFR